MSLAPIITFKAGICDLDVSESHPHRVKAVQLYFSPLFLSYDLSTQKPIKLFANF
jgi:hypothetical protein